MEWKTLKQVFIFIRNGKSIKQFGEKGYPITRIETIANRYVDEEKVGYANITSLESYKDYLLEKGDILMSHINSVKHLGKTAIFSSNNTLIHGMNLVCLRSNKEIINPYYGFYYLNSNIFLNQLPQITKNSVNQSSFNITNLKKLKIPVPPIETQKKIIEVLDKAQGLIDKRKEQIKLLDDLIESVFYDMFGDSVVNDKSWEVKKLKSMTSKIGSGATPKGGNSSYKDEGISLIRSMNVYDGKFSHNGLAFIDEKQAEKLSNVEVLEGDVLINITGASINRSCIVPMEILPARVNQHVSILRTIKGLNNYYLLYLLISKKFKQNLYNIATSGGATREAITKANLENLNIPIPSLNLQNEFAKKVGLIESQKRLMQKSLKLMEDNYNSLMQRAFKGELFQ